MQSSLPKWLRLTWVCFAPLGVAFAGRAAWEKTVWTIDRGPQVVGFSLLHIHPGFALGGAMCSYMLMLWLVPALYYLVARRMLISGFDTAMVFIAFLVVVAIVTPDDLLVRLHKT